MKLNIGTIIRDRRRAMDMTQEQLAERLGVTCQSVSRWENGMTYPDIEFLPLLADLFGITLDELMGHTKTAMEQRLAKLWEEYEAIDDDDLEAGFDHLARMREEYPNEWDAAHEMVRLAAWYNIRKDKLHALTMEVLENCADEEIRHDVTEIYLSTADEEAIDRPFLDKYTRVVDRFYLLEIESNRCLKKLNPTHIINGAAVDCAKFLNHAERGINSAFFPINKRLLSYTRTACRFSLGQTSIDTKGRKCHFQWRFLLS